MAIAEKNIVITSKDELNQTVIYKPYTSVDLVEGAVSSINGITPDEHGNIKVNTSGSSITVDDKLNKDSINPVQNKVVTKEIERIPYKLTVECIGFDGGKVNTDYTATGVIGLSLSTDKDYSKTDVGYGGAFASLMSHEVYSLDNKVQKTVYKGTPYVIKIEVYDTAVQFGDYYDPDQTEISGVITGDTDIVITFRKKREPVTLTINLKDKDGNFVCDDVSVMDYFDRTTTTVGTYGKTAGTFTVQVTKGSSYEITPLLKGYNNKEDNSPAEPNQTSINGTANNDETIDIVYNKIYPQDYETAWTEFHRTIASNPGKEVLPIGTELQTTFTLESTPEPFNFHIVNWRYAEKEDGSKVWGCDLLAIHPFLIDKCSFFSNSLEIGTAHSWEDSEIYKLFNNTQFIGDVLPVDFSKYLQKVKVTSSITKDTPIYTYDIMWIPSATEMYIDTTETIGTTSGLYGFTQITEGNDNEKYWKDVIKLPSKCSPSNTNQKLQFTDVTNPYWLRSSAFKTQPHPDGTIYTYDNDIYYVDKDGRIQKAQGTESVAGIRIMCFFA